MSTSDRAGRRSRGRRSRREPRGPGPGSDDEYEMELDGDAGDGGAAEPEARSGRARIAEQFAREFGLEDDELDGSQSAPRRAPAEPAPPREPEPKRAAAPRRREADYGRDAEYEVRRRASETRVRTAPRGADTRARIRHAVPAIAFAILIVSLGGIWFALGIFALGVVAMHELYGLMRRVRPIDLAGFIALAGLLLTALLGGREAMLIALVAALPVTFVLAVARPNREHVAWGIAATVFGIVWIGLAMGHAVLLRELDHGGALVVDVLIGTFIGDTCAYFGGRAWGRRALAPQISPSKTFEGMLAGIVGGTIAFWGFAVAYQDFFAGTDALIIGLCVALAAPVGDLFESLLKRDLDTKDTGGFFGAHGGVLDRLDAVLFSIVVGYYASLAVL